MSYLPSKLAASTSNITNGGILTDRMDDQDVLK